MGTATASVSGVQVAMGMRSNGRTKQENKSHTSLTCYPLSTGQKSSKNHPLNSNSKSNYMSTVPNNRSMMNHHQNVHESGSAVAAANSAYVSVKKSKTYKKDSLLMMSSQSNHTSGKVSSNTKVYHHNNQGKDGQRGADQLKHHSSACSSTNGLPR